MDLKGSKTEQNLKDAFAGESQANRRYLYFANKADVEGYNDVATVFRSTAEGETGHAHGHLDYLAPVGDPATGLPQAEITDLTEALAECEPDTLEPDGLLDLRDGDENEDDENKVVIILEMPPETYQLVRSRLDRLISAHDLTCHVRMDG